MVQRWDLRPADDVATTRLNSPKFKPCRYKKHSELAETNHTVSYRLVDHKFF